MNFKLALISSLAVVNALPTLIRREETSNSSSPSPGFIKQDLYSGVNFNAIQVSLGSGNQTVLLRLDTSSPEIWINSALNEYCLAYYPLDYSNSSSWNEFNIELQQDVKDSYESYQADAASELDYASGTEQLSSYGEAAKTKYSSFLSQQQVSVESKISGFVETATGDIPSSFETLGQGITSKAGVFATSVTSWGREFATDVTSIGGSAYTFVTEKGGNVASSVTSEGGQFASSITSEFGGLTADVLGGWNKLTQGFASAVLKRDEGTPTLSISSVAYSSSYSFVPQYDFSNQTSNQTSDFDIDLESIFLAIQNDCSLYGVYNYSSSDTFDTDDTYSILSYGEDFASGIWGNDTITISNVSVDSLIGVADVSDTNIGIFGIGKSSNETGIKSFPDILAESGEIGKSFYSLYLGEYESTIIFGGVAEEYFEGNITLFPLLNVTDGLAITLLGLNVSMDGISGRTNNSVSALDEKTPAYIDIISNPLLLPEVTLELLVGGLNSIFNVTYSDTYGRFLLTEKVESSTDNSTSSDDSYDISDILLTFDFQGSLFDVPLEQFVEYFDPDELAYYNTSTPYSQNITNSSFFFNIDLNTTDGSGDDDTDFDDDDVPEVYLLNILPSDTDAIVLGLDFFKDTIALFVDLEADVLGFAKSSENDNVSFNGSAIIEPDEKADGSDDDYYYISEDNDESKPVSIILVTDEIPYAVKAPDFDSYYGSENNH